LLTSKSIKLQYSIPKQIMLQSSLPKSISLLPANHILPVILTTDSPDYSFKNNTKYEITAFCHPEILQRTYLMVVIVTGHFFHRVYNLFMLIIILVLLK